MGLLSTGSPLDWEKAKIYAEYVKQNGIEQLLQTHNRARDRQDFLRWGDEVEYVLVECDNAARTCRVSLRAEKILSELKAEMKAKKDFIWCGNSEPNNLSAKFTATWHPEYGRYMLEGTPATPYCHDTRDLLCIEQNMIMRRKQAEALLQINEHLVAIGNFPRLGCPDAFDSSIKLTNEASHSLFFPDQYINTHARFK